ncbi:NERD domain-containing protein [Leifsonia xyli]|uniref:nuclease-related domain-containing protein n=1 Tax=Leifsonia xyli TaxID=1575 RepID=UPI000A69B3B7
MGEQVAGRPAVEGARVDFAGISALLSRPAGYAVAQKCLEVQAEAEAADPSLRTEQHIVLHPDARSWYVGALGEIEVGRLLSGLGPGWFLRHSVPIGAGTKDVDHLVIGPAGVFAINTKHHSGGSVWVGDHVLRINNQNKRYLSAAASDANDVSRRLAGKVGFEVPVTPVLAMLNARTINDKRANDQRVIAVVDANRLVAWLRAQPPRLTATQVDLLTLAAEEPQTWHVDPHAADTLRVMQRFERLVDRVGMPHPPEKQMRSASSAGRTARTSGGVARSRPEASQPRRAGKRVAGGIARLWGAAVLVIVGILVFRGLANQPCAAPTVCLLPPIYLALKPALLLVGLAAVGMAIVGTVLGLLRALVSARR